MQITVLNWELLDLTVISFLGLWIVLLGYKRYRTGTVPRRSLEEIGVLSYVNNVRWLRRQPRQDRLTERNVRVFGLVEIIVGCFALAYGLLMVCQYVCLW